LLRALLLQAFYTIRSERRLMEQLDYNLLYRCFVGLGVDEPVWVPTVFTKSRDRLLEAQEDGSRRHQWRDVRSLTVVGRTNRTSEGREAFASCSCWKPTMSSSA
jgi:hypothetical protein